MLIVFSSRYFNLENNELSIAYLNFDLLLLTVLFNCYWVNDFSPKIFPFSVVFSVETFDLIYYLKIVFVE